MRGEAPSPYSILKKREERAEIGDFIRGDSHSPFSLLQKRGGIESGDWRLLKRGDPFSILIIIKKRGRREQRLETS
jgi:hypothetical protein